LLKLAEKLAFEFFSSSGGLHADNISSLLLLLDAPSSSTKSADAADFEAVLGADNSEREQLKVTRWVECRRSSAAAFSGLKGLTPAASFVAPTLDANDEVRALAIDSDDDVRDTGWKHFFERCAYSISSYLLTSHLSCGIDEVLTSGKPALISSTLISEDNFDMDAPFLAAIELLSFLGAGGDILLEMLILPWLRALSCNCHLAIGFFVSLSSVEQLLVIFNVLTGRVPDLTLGFLGIPTSSLSKTSFRVLPSTSHWWALVLVTGTRGVPVPVTRSVRGNRGNGIEEVSAQLSFACISISAA
jgi:hypothetical protein